MAKSKPKEVKEEAKTVVSYKGFKVGMTCQPNGQANPFKFEVGGEYEHSGEVKACNSGFHACEYPLDVFGYYDPASSEFALVEQSGFLDRHDGDSKIASSKITVKAKISLGEMIKAAVDFTFSRVKEIGAASNSGTRGAASNSGYQGAASNSGYQGAASNSGTRGAASNSGYQGAASNSGDYGAASNAGYQGAASTEGKQTIAAVFGGDSKARASKGNWIVLCFRTEFDDDYKITHVKSAQAGVTSGIKADTWYKLDKDGNFVEII